MDDMHCCQSALLSASSALLAACNMIEILGKRLLYILSGIRLEVYSSGWSCKTDANVERIR